MTPTLRRKLEALAGRREELERLLADPGVIGDGERFRAFSREFAQLEPVATAMADEKRAPSQEAWEQELAANPEPAPAAPKPVAQPGSAPVRRVVGDASPSSAAAVEGNIKLAEAEREVLIVVSKMKKYIKDRAGFNCSDAVAEHLSDHVRAVCDEAIRAAARDERKTVLDRDVPRVRR